MHAQPGHLNSFGTHQRVDIQTQSLSMHHLPTLARGTGRDLTKLPRSLRILLENLLRHEDGDIVNRSDIEALLNWSPRTSSGHEIQFTPARVLLQDFTGVPVIADLAAMRSALALRGGTPERVNPLQPVDLVIDHSVQVDAFASLDAFDVNSRLEFERNHERYEFLKWGQHAFENFRVVPPSTGICHQVNLEYLAHVAMRTKRISDGECWVHPDTLVGTDSHTPMVNGLGVLGWGVGGIEAEAAMLGQPCSMLIPDVIGFELYGRLRPGVTATDLVLMITEILRKKGVVGKFVEFTGDGVARLSIADRATISNMAPEYGATVGLWPVDAKTVEYLRLTGREDRALLTEMYFKRQELWFEPGQPSPEFSDLVTLDLAEVEPSLAGPSRPQDRVPISGLPDNFVAFSKTYQEAERPAPTSGEELRDGHIVIAAITSCTNTSNPALMIAAGLLARNAVNAGLVPPKWVKTSFAPGSKAVTRYLRDANLTPYLEAIGFHLVGYGCTTCIGNSGPLPEDIAAEVEKRRLTVAAVLSGNRNFEARIHPQVRANYLCSPPLVIAFALAGRIDVNLNAEPVGRGRNGPVFLRDLWPQVDEINDLMNRHVTTPQFTSSYSDVTVGDENWSRLRFSGETIYNWSTSSTYIARPPFLDEEPNDPAKRPNSIENARILAIFGNSITTDHISPAGSIGPKSPAGQYLASLGVERKDFNSYGARRGHHEVMVRGTFANVRLRNRLVNREGGYTRIWPEGREATIYEASMHYLSKKIPLVIFAGHEYGSGSSRDWAAKGTRLLGVRAVIASSFERIHRSNLVGMGVMPLELPGHISVESLELEGHESITILQLEDLAPKAPLNVVITAQGRPERRLTCRCRIDTANELRYYRAGGILPFVLERLT